MKKNPAPRRPRGETTEVDPYKPARRPVRSGEERPSRERLGRSFDKSARPAPARLASARPARSFDRPPSRPPRDRDGESPRVAPRRFSSDEERGSRGFTVNLDPDVARVFRGDASVNKALRLVLQLMQVVQGPASGPRTGPPREGGRSYGSERPARGGGYRGSAEARGFERKPRFQEDSQE